ncbi:MAG TPA: GNAT family N-acetyltransferase [Thermomicrobiales bacterium]|nr:GNAT family N-acetyltransferase [Thermomicrobiales bacterium]
MSETTPGDRASTREDAKPSTLFDLSTHTFLVGEEIALRPVTTEDAPWTTSWRESVFPFSPSTTETWIEEEIGGDAGNPYLVVRKADGRPVGSLMLDGTFPGRHVRVFIDPLFGERATAWKTEVFRLLVPWQVVEKHIPILHTGMPDDDPTLLDALRAMGWRETARFPRLSWSERRQDWADHLMLEYLNPQWVSMLGDPNDEPLERSGLGTPRPVPAPVPAPENPPKQAIMIGERVYLRPLNKDDALPISELSRQEPDAIWSIGRRIYSPAGYAGWTNHLQKDDPQTWVRFAICLRESDEVIGSLGLAGIRYIPGFAETESEINRAEYRAGGYGSEAKHLLFEYAFNRLGLHAVHSWVAFPNTRSAAALRKQGYTESGRMNWAYPLNGGFGNAVVFTLHADDWRAMPRQARTAIG